MDAVNKADELKSKTLDYVKRNGPVLPIQISREIGRDSFFAGAILSDLFSSKQVLLSHAKIGGSKIYYVKGQEPKLEILYNYLPMKEKEAYNLLKNKKVLRDSEQEPSIRVALRSLKDFAKPLEINFGGSQEIFWRWHLIDDNEARNIAREDYFGKEKPELQKDLIKQEKKTRQRRGSVEDLFLKNVREHLARNNIDVLSVINTKKNKEAELIVRFSSVAGVLNYYLFAKSKKKITEADISMAYNKAHSRKMPLFFLTDGDIAKKSKEYLERDMKGIVFSKL